MCQEIFLLRNFTLISVLISVIISAAVFGWVAPVMNHLLDPKNDINMTPTQLSWMIVIPEIGDLLVSTTTGVVADKWGRKPCILLSGPIFAAGWIIIMFTKSYTVICFVRIAHGIAIGVVLSVVPKYVREISRPSKCNSITGLFSSAWFLGYLIEYIVGSFVSYSMFTAFTAIIPVIFTIIFSFQSESPYYLVMKGNDIEAAETLALLRRGSTEKEIEDEFEQIKNSAKEKMASTVSLKDIIATPVDRRILFTFLLMGSVRIISGGFVIMPYSTHLLSENTNSSFFPDLFTMIMVFFLFLGGFIKTSIANILGRRPLIFVSPICSFFCMLALTLHVFLQSKLSARIYNYSWIIPLAIISYCIFSTVGIYPVSMTFTFQIFTTKTRKRAVNIFSISITIISFICVKMYQQVSIAYGLLAEILCLTIFSALGTMVFYKIVPKSKRKTFPQSLQYLVNISRVRKTNRVIDV